MTIPDIVTCPRCTHTGTPRDGRFRIHNQPGADQPCPLSLQLLPPAGETPGAYLSRARLVADLAVQLQDADPNTVWQYLTALPGAELQRIAMLALAAIPVDRTLNEIWAWVTELPAAKETA